LCFTPRTGSCIGANSGARLSTSSILFYPKKPEYNRTYIIYRRAKELSMPDRRTCTKWEKKGYFSPKKAQICAIAKSIFSGA
jgi:hypothetical protein